MPPQETRPGISAGAAAIPVGETLAWQAAKAPRPLLLPGRFARLEPIDITRHLASLYQEASLDPDIWTYMAHGPFSREDEFRVWLQGTAESAENVFFVVVDEVTGRAQGMVSYLRMVPPHGVIEIGYIWFSPRLQRTAAATEAIYLLLHHAFDELGYRRVEWKCDALNAASRRAAERFGFQYEGIFRQHMVVKGRNRDTAWYALLDRNWPVARSAFQVWLSPANFDAAGKQRAALATIRAGTEPSGQTA